MKNRRHWMSGAFVSADKIYVQPRPPKRGFISQRSRIELAKSAPNVSELMFVQIRTIDSKYSAEVSCDPRQDRHFNIFKQAKDYDGKGVCGGLGAGVEKNKNEGFAIGVSFRWI